MDVARRLARDGGRQPRLQPIVDAVERHEAAIVRVRQRDRDRMRLRRPLQVDDAHVVGAKAVGRFSAEAADDRGPHPQPRRGGRGDDGAAADGRDEARGLQLLAVPRHVREADEDQILERFADGEQVDCAARAGKYSPRLG